MLEPLLLLLPLFPTWEEALPPSLEELLLFPPPPPPRVPLRPRGFTSTVAHSPSSASAFVVAVAVVLGLAASVDVASLDWVDSFLFVSPLDVDDSFLLVDEDSFLFPGDEADAGGCSGAADEVVLLLLPPAAVLSFVSDEDALLATADSTGELVFDVLSLDEDGAGVELVNESL